MKLSPQTIQHTRNKLRKHDHWFRAATWLGHVNESDYIKYLKEFTHQRNEHLKEIHHHEPHALAAYCCLTHPAHQRIVLKGFNLSTVIQIIILLLLILLVSRSAHGQTALQNAQIVSTCGTTNFTYTAAAGAPWNWAPVTIDSNGNICISGTISATNPSVSATGASVPSSATFFGANFGGNLVGLVADASNYLLVDCPGCSGVSPFADNAAFVAGTTGINLMGAWYSSSPTACTDGHGCTPSLTGDRKLFTQNFQGTSPWVISFSAPQHVVIDSSGAISVTQGTSPWVVSGTVAFSNTTIAVTNAGTFAVQATLSAETTKVIGTVNQGTSPWVTSFSAPQHIIIDSGSISNTTFAVTNTGTFADQSTLQAGTAIAGKFGIDQTTDITTNGIEVAPTAGAAAGITPVASTAVESGHILKGSAGNLYSATVTATVSGLFMVFNSTTVPVDGAVTPIYCVPCNIGNDPTCMANVNFIPGPLGVFGTGISVAYSTGSNCANKAASATAWFTGLVK